MDSTGKEIYVIKAKQNGVAIMGEIIVGGLIALVGVMLGAAINSSAQKKGQ